MSWRASLLLTLLVGAVYGVARPWVVERFGARPLAVGVVAAAVALSLAVATWQARRRRYRCPACGHHFPVSMVRHLTSQNWFQQLRARCPKCGHRAWCAPVLRAAE